MANYRYESTWQLQRGGRGTAAIGNLDQLPGWYPAVNQSETAGRATTRASAPGSAMGSRAGCHAAWPSRPPSPRG